MNAARRNLLILAGMAGFVGLTQAAPGWLDRLPADFDFAPVAGHPDFRRWQGGAQTAPNTALVGLSPPAASDEPLPADIPGALFFAGAAPAGIAYFHDYYCPVCRTFSDEIRSVAAETGLPLSLHDYPLFGEASSIAARAALAGRALGAERPVRERLAATPLRITMGWVRQEAAAFGFDPGAFIAAMQSPAVDAQLATTRALARSFGLIGTPSSFIGRTVIDGRISVPRMRQLIALETA